MSEGQTVTGAASSAQALSAAQVALANIQARKDAAGANAPATAAAPAPAPASSPDAPSPVIRTGEVVTSTVAGLEGGKTYYHRVHGARTIMPDGREIVFAGGMFATDDPEIIHELDKVANKAASQIFTRREAIGSVLAAENKAAQEAGDSVGDNKNV